MVSPGSPRSPRGSSAALPPRGSSAARPRREAGSALLFAIGAIVVVAMAVLLLADYLDTCFSAFSTEQSNVVLTNLSDAAFAETLARMASSRDYPGFPDREFGSGGADFGRISSQVVETGRKGQGRNLQTMHAVTALAIRAERAALIKADVYIDRDGNVQIKGWTRLHGPADSLGTE